jgi:phosphoglucosamine mutase
MRKKEAKLSELAKVMVTYPQISINVPVKEKNKNILADSNIKSKIKNIDNTISKKGRLVIRMSGTEPLVRIMMEGEDKNEIEMLSNELAEFIRKKL